MPFRDELEQAHRRIEHLEQELEEERQANAPQPAPLAKDAPAVPRVAPKKSSLLDMLVQWWPALTTVLATFGYFAAFGLTLPSLESPDPWQWGLVSAFAGSFLSAVDVVLRSRSTTGERTMLGRILVILSYIAGAPVLVALFFAGSQLLAIAIPLVLTALGVIALVRWIRTGKFPDGDPPTDANPGTSD